MKTLPLGLCLSCPPPRRRAGRTRRPAPAPSTAATTTAPRPPPSTTTSPLGRRQPADRDGGQAGRPRRLQHHPDRRLRPARQHLPAGDYTINVNDLSKIHNFHFKRRLRRRVHHGAGGRRADVPGQPHRRLVHLRLRPAPAHDRRSSPSPEAPSPEPPARDSPGGVVSGRGQARARPARRPPPARPHGGEHLVDVPLRLVQRRERADRRHLHVRADDAARQRAQADGGGRQPGGPDGRASTQTADQRGGDGLQEEQPGQRRAARR